MDPVAFNLFGLSVRWYGIFITIGILVALILGKARSKKYNISFDVIMDIFIIALPSAIVGARLYYVIFEWSYYGSHLIEILNIRGGGLAIHGGIIGAIIACYFMCKKYKVSLLNLLDLAAPCFPIAQAIGRWGNFFNSEAHGSAVSKEFISHFPSFIQKGMFIDGSYFQPTFLYESVWDVGVFIALLLLSKKDLRRGSAFYLYVLLYSIGRFFIEGLRTDSLWLGPIRVAQLLSLVLIIGSIVLLVIKPKEKISD